VPTGSVPSQAAKRAASAGFIATGRGGTSLTVAAQASSQEMLISLVAGGYAVGLSCTAQLKAHDIEDIVLRPLAGEAVHVSTHLL